MSLEWTVRSREVLAGLVGITAGCAWFSFRDAAIIGFMSGLLSVGLCRILASAPAHASHSRTERLLMFLLL